MLEIGLEVESGWFEEFGEADWVVNLEEADWGPAMALAPALQTLPSLRHLRGNPVKCTLLMRSCSSARKVSDVD